MEPSISRSGRPLRYLLVCIALAATWLAACGGDADDGQQVNGASTTPHTATSQSLASPTAPEMAATHDHTAASPATATPASIATATEAIGATEIVPEQATATLATEPTQQTSVDVRIIDFGFDPPMLEITAGTTVTFTNEGVDHTATSREAPLPFDTGILHTGEQFTVTFDTPGSYDYWCLLHPNMIGMIVVK